MSILNIAFTNFKNNVKTYTMFFISMIFSVVILSNFQILIYGNLIKEVDKINADLIKFVIQALAIVLIAFMFFYIWYSTNMFLNKRKREIGIYTFMGIDQLTIGKMYFLENMMIGVSSCLTGILIGIITSKFFQVLVLKIAQYNIDVPFEISSKAIIETAKIFLIIFLIFSIKGLISIYKSKIIDLLNANRENDKVCKVKIIYYIVGILSIVGIIYGYYNIISNGLFDVVSLLLIVIATYGIFGALLPASFDFIVKRKRILYRNTNIISLNNIASRIGKNYKTYATLALLIAATITSLGATICFKVSYDNAIKMIKTYDFAFVSTSYIDNQKINNLLNNKLSREIEVPINIFNGNVGIADSNVSYEKFLFMDKENLVNILKENNEIQAANKIENMDLKDNECVIINQKTALISIDFSEEEKQAYMGNDIYDIKEKINAILLGDAYRGDFIIFNDNEYNRISKESQKINFYGIKLEEDADLDSLNIKLQNDLGNEYDSIYYSGKSVENLNWYKFVYAISVFLSIVFILSTASIIYIKLYNEGIDDKKKYMTLLKIGIDKDDIGRAINKEVMLFYIFPVIVASIHGYFSIKEMGEYLSVPLSKVYILSFGISIFIFACMCLMSIKAFKNLILKK